MTVLRLFMTQLQNCYLIKINRYFTIEKCYGNIWWITMALQVSIVTSVIALENTLNSIHISEKGERTIPMIDEMYDAFLEEYQIWQVLGFGTNEIDGFTNFVFFTGEGNVYTLESINRAIKRIYEDYNKKKNAKAKEEGREPLLLSHFSEHNLRYTFCTRLCENESNLKVIQSVMGHSDIQTKIFMQSVLQKRNSANVNIKL